MVALFITATGKYINFLPKLLQTANQYFLPGIQKQYVVFTDKTDFKLPIPVTIVKVAQATWPYSTMYRCIHYISFLKHTHHQQITHIFAIDADAYFASEITPENILANTVAVQHCRYVNEIGDYETNPQSACYIDATKKDNPIYYGGGFYGGSATEFMKINEWMMLNTQWNTVTKKQSIIPKWHDESALNKYFWDNPPQLVLSPAYHWPEYGNDAELNPFIERLWQEQEQYLLNHYNQKLPIQPKIILIDKNKGHSKGTEEWRNPTV